MLTCTKYRPADLTIEKEAGTGKTIRCKYFETVLLEVSGERIVPVSDDSFRALVCIRGEGTLTVDGQAQPVRAGDSFFIPAADNRITLEGDMTVAVTGV